MGTQPTADPEVVDNPDQHRFEIRSGDRLAGFAQYRPAGDTVVFTHTEIDDDFEGQGLGGRLVRAALDEVRGRGHKVRPDCPFVANYIKRHPDDLDLVDDAHRRQLEEE